MNVNPAAASIAGTARAARRGGEADNQAGEATRQQATSETPAGKSPEAAVDAGDQTGDRGGNGRQVLDRFEHAEDNDEGADQQPPQGSQPASPEGTGGHLDLQA